MAGSVVKHESITTGANLPKFSGETNTFRSTKGINSERLYTDVRATAEVGEVDSLIKRYEETSPSYNPHVMSIRAFSQPPQSQR